MFVADGRSSAPSAPTVGRARSCRPARRRPASTATRQGSAGLIAAEDPVGYDTGPADTAEERVDGDPHGEGAWGWPIGGAPRATEARARLERCATAPGSPLGAAVGALGGAVDALAGSMGALAGSVGAAGAGGDRDGTGDPTGAAARARGVAEALAGVPGEGLAGEHPDLVGDALVAVAHLRARLDACELALLAEFDRRGGHRADGAVTVSSWLAGRTGTDYSATARQTTTARRLAGLPRLAGHLAAGDITLAHATAVTDRCVPARAERFSETEPILADLAASNPPRDVRHAVRPPARRQRPRGRRPSRRPRG